MPIDMTKITKEMVAKALECETAEELVALAKANGFTLTKEEAEAYLSEMDNMELDQQALDQVAGGGGYACESNSCGSHHCFAGDSEVAVPGGVNLIKDLKVGDKVITLDASGKEIIGVVTEVMTPAEEEIVEVTFSNGTLLRTTESQPLYLAHNQ
ncbi:MAG: Hint domain-containing protein, partial [Spirochaetia bacterium]|nr:Hint domain-containing protein [Spirochaetia bacterium]